MQRGTANAKAMQIGTQSAKASMQMQMPNAMARCKYINMQMQMQNAKATVQMRMQNAKAQCKCIIQNSIPNEGCSAKSPNHSKVPNCRSGPKCPYLNIESDVCMYVCMPLCAFMYVYVYVYVCACMSACQYVYMYVCGSVYM